MRLHNKPWHHFASQQHLIQGILNENKDQCIHIYIYIYTSNITTDNQITYQYMSERFTSCTCHRLIIGVVILELFLKYFVDKFSCLA